MATFTVLDVNPVSSPNPPCRGLVLAYARNQAAERQGRWAACHDLSESRNRNLAPPHYRGNVSVWHWLTRD
jgi:hypothetical protein